MSGRETLRGRHQVQKAVYAAIDGLNEQLEDGQKLDKSLDTQLLGRGGKLDSIGFINLIVLLEEKCREHCGVVLSLADTAQVVEPNPFESISSLVDHLDRLIEAKRVHTA